MSLSDRIAVIYKGDIQQCGSPYDIYTNPANIFVGGFIGIPPMNFLKATVVGASPFRIEVNGLALSPQVEKPPSGTDVMVGVRPEDVIIAHEKMENSFEVTVRIIEPAGSYNWIDVAWKNASVKGKASVSENLRAGDIAFMKISSGKLFVFDAESEERLF